MIGPGKHVLKVLGSPDIGMPSANSPGSADDAGASRQQGGEFDGFHVLRCKTLLQHLQDADKDP